MWKRWWGRKPEPGPGEESGGRFRSAAETPGAGVYTAEDEQLLDRIALATIRWGMAVPAVFMLESSKPLSFVGSQFLHFLSPIVHAVLDAKEIDVVGAMYDVETGAVEFL